MECEYKISEIIPVVHWNYRELEHIPEKLIHDGKHVTDVYLKGNSISSLPLWVSELQNLTEIFLTENRLNHLPEPICQLRSLRVLHVDRNAISHLPEAFVALSQLSEFNADENLLEYLPEGMGKMGSLFALYLNRNRLKKIPESLSQCDNLSELSLNDNKIEILPRSLIFLPNLTLFSACNNPLVILPVLPFQSKPIVRIGPTIHASHISVDWVDYVSALRQQTTLRRGDELPSINYNSFILDKIYDENNYIVPSLYELSLRLVYTLLVRYRELNNHILELLPDTIRKEFLLGPTAACRRCFQNMFKIAYIRFRSDRYEIMKQRVVEYYCSPTCRLKGSTY